MATGNEAAIAAEEARRVAAEARLKDALKEFYGDEKTLFVENTTKGGVSIGFGKIGTEAGHLGYLIERSRLPINLTDKFPVEYWRDSPDFRQALSKGWLRIVSKETFEASVEAARAHEARLAALAGNEAPARVAYDAQINPLQERQLNERTAQLESTYVDETARKVQEYESRLAAPLNQPVISDGRSARAEALVEKTKRGQISSLDSLKELDSDATLYTDDDLAYIRDNAEFAGLKSFAGSLLNTRRGGK